MKYGIYCIYDEKARVFMQPFTDSNDATAMRAFSNQVLHNDLLKDNPIDFELYKCGLFDNEHCTIEPKRELLMSGKDVIVK